MVLSPETKEFLEEKKEAQIAHAAEKQAEDMSEVLRKKREELEIKKIDLEMKKLEQGATSFDPFSKLLEFQQKSFDDRIKQNEEMSNLKVEIEKLKMGEGGEESDDMLEMFKMIVPILTRSNNQPPSRGLTGESAASQPLNFPVAQVAAPQIQEKMDTEAQLKQYKQLIKEGKITEDQAWKDLKTYYPEEAKKTTRKGFHKLYEDVKNG